MISVVIPAYNVEETILSTIKSVQAQTVKDLEIIVINDGSSDRTLALLATVKDERLKVYSYSNEGLSTARNRGIARSQGDYISFLDADDLWTPCKLEKQLAALQANPECFIAYSWNMAMVEAEDDAKSVNFISGGKVDFTGNIYPPLLLNNFIGNGSNILVRREGIQSVGEFDTSLKSCEDWDYCLRLASKYHFTLVSEHQILYRKTAKSMSSKGSIIEAEGLKVINKTFQTAPQRLQYLKNKSLARFAIACGRIYIDRNCSFQDRIKARKRLFKALRLDYSIFFSKDTQILWIKILLKQLLPKKAVSNLISWLKKPLEVENFN
jgi:glycosyltransferase involved in cell wall biosynthesis